MADAGGMQNRLSYVGYVRQVNRLLVVHEKNLSSVELHSTRVANAGGTCKHLSSVGPDRDSVADAGSTCTHISHVLPHRERVDVAGGM